MTSFPKLISCLQEITAIGLAEEDGWLAEARDKSESWTGDTVLGWKSA